MRVLSTHFTTILNNMMQFSNCYKNNTVKPKKKEKKTQQISLFHIFVTLRKIIDNISVTF